MRPLGVKPKHKAIRVYYETLAGYDRQDVVHETAVRTAFQSLLAEVAKKRKWTLVPELSTRAAGARIVPDGTLRDDFQIPRAYWEAKDTDDDLEVEIAKKIAKGYPTTNTIFEDTRQAVLYQDGEPTFRADLTDASQLADLLNQFFTYSEPRIDEFEKAVDEFKSRVPELAQGLVARIREAHRNNRPFITAFADFFALCQTSLNPNISEAAVDEMLVQHLLTERLFRTIFDNPDFIHKNVIAAEVEKVIAALVSKSFNRHEFLKSLDRFYMAIEDAARDLADFTEKQHFLNTVYERFFQGYSVKVADTHGIVYTPQPIVDFMCASIDQVLQGQFGKRLGSKDVHILDPCTGTGNFIVNLLCRIPKRDLPRMYREQLFANEVMLLPYYIAALNIEHSYFELAGEYEPFEGLCFVDTLDMAEHAQGQLGFMTKENTGRVEREKKTPITVVVGNPPYNVGQINENDNNKNRKYDVVDERIKETYAADSKATNKNALSDAYVKFFRWAVDRLEGRDGIVCFVSNNSFVHQIAFDGMRKHLMQDFTSIYHVDLHGNVRKNPKLSGTTHNVFGIQVGVGITVAVRKATTPDHDLYYHRVPETWRKQEKLDWLVERKNISGLSSAAVPAAVSGASCPRYGHVTVRDRGRLPHWEAEDSVYFITFRLADSLPANVLADMEAERERLAELANKRGRKLSKAEQQEMQRVFSERVEEFLDNGAGKCYLADPKVAAMVGDALLHFDGQRYGLLAWCIMPNHVHMLLRLIPGWSLADVLHSIKSYSAKEANKILGRRGTFWQREYYDHIVRDEEEYGRRLAYVVENPQRAGLDGWQWVGYCGEVASGVGDGGQDARHTAGGDAGATMTAAWQHLTPDSDHTWLVPEHAEEFARFVPLGTKAAKSAEETDVECVFKVFSSGVKTNRDDVVYDFDREALADRVRRFIDDYNGEVDRYRRATDKPNIDDFVRYDKIKWSMGLKLALKRGRYAEYAHGKIRESLYRPFCKRHLFFDRVINEAVYQQPHIFPTPESEQENTLIWLKVGSEWPVFALISRTITDLLPQGGSQCFPFYVYEEDGGNRRENITDWALHRFREHYDDQTIDKWDIFYYIYALLHHPGYREKYAGCLKRELPHIPFARRNAAVPAAVPGASRPHKTTPQSGFRAFSNAGKELAQWHLDYEQVEPYELNWIVAQDRPLSYLVEDKMRLSKDKTELEVNPSLTLTGIPTETFDYRLGNRSALEWVIDQYRVKVDKRTGTRSDPNRPDDPEYIVRLVGQVVCVSVATVRIVNALPQQFGG